MSFQSTFGWELVARKPTLIRGLEFSVPSPTPGRGEGLGLDQSPIANDYINHCKEASINIQKLIGLGEPLCWWTHEDLGQGVPRERAWKLCALSLLYFSLKQFSPSFLYHHLSPESWGRTLYLGYLFLEVIARSRSRKMRRVKWERKEKWCNSALSSCWPVCIIRAQHH